ncbi:hypothetical protein PDE_00082 [Penicillium oxalicum 114-2]|uniref:Sulfotransferase domain-containing protein n=1 Tax=Penicillium oxalicum (strain 114-2 / CGMCC 5302) TaxID=933388 RepID=S7Z901_PENO1|nr:hypothetical protein PDE_00082 [Penicillium oxalicum 114-2]
MTVTPEAGVHSDLSQQPAVAEYRDEEHGESVGDITIGEFGYKYRIHDGRVMPPFIGAERYKMTRSLPMKSTDICFVSWPRSGSTWLSYIIVLLTGVEGETLRDSFHWPESGWLYERDEAALRDAKDPRIFASHMPFDMALGGNPTKTPARYIYISRNPKDVCTSCYYFDREKSWSGWYSGSWKHWLNMFIEGQCHRGDWFDHVLSWWEQRDAKNVLFLKYEDLLTDPKSKIREISQFLGLDHDDAALEIITKKASFGLMKKSKFTGMGDIKEAGDFYREGRIGSWKDQFTVAQNDAFDKLYRSRMAGSGLDFDFE